MTNSYSRKPIASKRERFVEVGERRTTKAIRAIRQVGKLVNGPLYSLSQDDVDQIIDTLANELEMAKAHMSESIEQNDEDFAIAA